MFQVVTFYHTWPDLFFFILDYYTLPYLDQDPNLDEMEGEWEIRNNTEPEVVGQVW